MNIIIFLLILSLLVFVHELGHFLMAKWNNVRVDTFAIGFEPTLFKKKIGETTYKLNALIFGGYVKIYGETPDADNMTGPDAGRSLINKKRWQQALVLFGGILFNMIFAWMVLTATVWTGAPTVIDSTTRTTNEVSNEQLMILDVMEGSPAEEAGLQTGDVIAEITSDQEITLAQPYQRDEVVNLIKETEGSLDFRIDRPGLHQPLLVSVMPASGIIDSATKGIGVSLENIGTVHESFFGGMVEGLKRTVAVTVTTIKGFYQLITGTLSLKMVSGPVGLVGVVGDASSLGFTYILNLIAVISINLAVLNLIPFPALDGGRLLFVLIEKIQGKVIRPVIANTINMIGFGLLILLMVVITVKDVIGLF